MKIYGVSTTRNGAITNMNYDNISATGVDAETGIQYHRWFPVPIPTGTNSMFNAITTSQVDAVVTPWAGSNEDNTDSLVQERMILIHNDSPVARNNVKIFISDQQLTGGVVELTPWNMLSLEIIKPYDQIITNTTVPTDYRVDKVYFDAYYPSSGLGNSTEINKEINTSLGPWGWYAAALRLYVVKDQAVEEDFCIIATESS
ncbi:hypothetical protein UFOVP660_15 [uncultured Caudovirales phage]|uniref:Uncharacterized protein n=1 Tax=uncultured Caudovirales phage TaxID=2100421 RepID=A0A6J5NEI9_9CAUD|nr:hypothetical protein UFOVP660_15 [uncultured Caudovirales phage]